MFMQFNYHRPIFVFKIHFAQNPISLNGHDACDSNDFRGPAHSHTATSPKKRVILVHSFILYLHLIHPSASFFFSKTLCK